MAGAKGKAAKTADRKRKLSVRSGAFELAGS